MGPVASAFKRAAILSLVTYVLAVLFIAAQFMPRYPADALHTLRDSVKPESLAILIISASLLAGYFLKGRGDPFEPSGDWVSRMAKVFMGAIAITGCVLVVIVIVGVLFRGSLAVSWYAMFPRTLIRIGFALMLAIAIIRMTLPLLPRSDRMTSHNE
ncbi:MAG: hypothetical protein QM773_18205 [Hyphomonadaceae bacterium]